MFEIVRTKNVKALDVVAKDLIVDESTDTETVLNELRVEMIDNPKFLFLVVLDGETIVGHLIAYQLPLRNFVSVESAKLDANYKEASSEAFSQLEKFTLEECDTNEMRFETERSSAAFARAYGFEEYSIIMRKFING